MFFVISSLYILFIFGLGYLLVDFLCLRNNNSPLIEKVPIIFINGLLLHHLILLLAQSLKLSLLVSTIICSFGLIWFIMRQKKELILNHHNDWFPFLAIVFILILYYFAILYYPLQSWDARSIWFFHSKMIWSAGSLNVAAGWNHPSLQWSHVDYPKLVPALAAQLSSVLGYWNEYAPKFSLFLILIPGIFLIFSFYSRRFSFLFLLLVFPFGLERLLWNGFMDGYVALYSAVSVLLLGRYFQEHRLIDLMSALSCLALLSNIKNEGIAVGLLGTVSIVISATLFKSFKLNDLKKHFNPYLITWLAIIISPCMLWSIFYKHKLRLVNDLQIGTAEAFFRLINHFSDGVSFRLILKESIFHEDSSLWLALVVLIVSMIFLKIYKQYTVSWFPALFTAITYYCCLVIIYLMTPADLNWHLSTSVQRTMLVVSGCIFAGTYFILIEIEKALKGWKL